MTQVVKSIKVMERRKIAIESSDAHLLALLEPLFLIDTHVSFEERMQLFKLAYALRQGFVACEIGSYLGASTCFLAAAASLKEGQVHAIDTWKNDAMPGEPIIDTFDQFVQNIQPFRQRIMIHRGLASDVKDAIEQIDMLFIDGDHGYEGTLADLTHYVPKIVSGGFLAIHDFIFESVQAAVRDYFKTQPLHNLGTTNTLQAFQLP